MTAPTVAVVVAAIGILVSRDDAVVEALVLAKVLIVNGDAVRDEANVTGRMTAEKKMIRCVMTIPITIVPGQGVTDVEARVRLIPMIAERIAEHVLRGAASDARSVIITIDRRRARAQARAPLRGRARHAGAISAITAERIKIVTEIETEGTKTKKKEIQQIWKVMRKILYRLLTTMPRLIETTVENNTRVVENGLQ